MKRSKWYALGLCLLVGVSPVAYATEEKVAPISVEATENVEKPKEKEKEKEVQKEESEKLKEEIPKEEKPVEEEPNPENGLPIVEDLFRGNENLDALKEYLVCTEPTATFGWHLKKSVKFCFVVEYEDKMYVLPQGNSNSFESVCKYREEGLPGNIKLIYEGFKSPLDVSSFDDVAEYIKSQKSAGLDTMLSTYFQRNLKNSMGVSLSRLDILLFDESNNYIGSIDGVDSNTKAGEALFYDFQTNAKADITPKVKYSDDKTSISLY